MRVRALVLVVVALGVLALWGLRHEPSRASPLPGASSVQVSADESAPVRDLVDVPRSEETTERRALEPSERDGPAEEGEEQEEEREEEEADPPTPEHPGPGQALLRVEVVARETGAALAGAELDFLPTDGDVEHEWLSSTQSDPSRGVENDTLLTNAEGRGEFVVQTDYGYTLRGSGKNGLADEAELALEPFHEGEEREVRLALPTAWTLDWYGRVVDGASERPLTGVEVVALADSSDKAIFELAELARGRTVGDGRIVLRLPAWERVLVRCELPGYFWGGARIDPNAVMPEVAQSVALRHPAALVARVINPGGRPAEGIEVRVSVPLWSVVQDRYGDDLRWRLFTDAEGRVEFSELPSVAHVFVELRRGERVLEWTKRSETLQLQPGERREVEFRLPAGVTLTGRVIDREGRPLEGVALRLQSVSYSLEAPQVAKLLLGKWFSPDRLSSSGPVVASATTDEDGRFTIEAVRPGSWAIGPEEQEDMPDVVQPFLVRADELAPHIELTLDQGLFIESVVSGPDDRAAGRVSIYLRGEDGGFLGLSQGHGFSDRDGHFRFGPLPSGRYRIQAVDSEQPLFAPSEEVEVEAGGPPLSLRMRWGGEVHVRAIDEEGRPIEGEPGVEMLAESGGPALRAPYPEHLLPGIYAVLVTAEDGRVGVVRGLRVGAQQVVEIDVLVVPGASLAFPAESSVDRIEVEWEGLRLRTPYPGPPEFLLPPGAVTLRFSAWGDDGEIHLLDTRSRTLAAGDEWKVELPP